MQNPQAVAGSRSPLPVVLFMVAALAFTGFTLGWTFNTAFTRTRIKIALTENKEAERKAFDKGVLAGSAFSLAVQNEIISGGLRPTNLLGEIYRRAYTNYPNYKP